MLLTSFFPAGRAQTRGCGPTRDAAERARHRGHRQFQWREAESVGLKRTIGDAVFQRHALEELHDDKGMPVLLAYVINRADVGVIQS